MNVEFVPFPKIARLDSTCTVTEKIDGTGWDFIAAVVVAVCGIGYAIIPPRCCRPNTLAVQCDELDARDAGGAVLRVLFTVTVIAATILATIAVT